MPKPGEQRAYDTIDRLRQGQALLYYRVRLNIDLTSPSMHAWYNIHQQRVLAQAIQSG